MRNWVIFATVLLTMLLCEASWANTDATLSVATDPPGGYIAVMKPLPSGLPTPGASGHASAVFSDPTIDNQVFDHRTYEWSIVSPVASPPLYNYNPVIASPNEQGTSVSLGLKVTGQVNVTVKVVVKWYFRPESGGSAYPDPQVVSSATGSIPFVGLQVRVSRVPLVIAANATGALPINFQIDGAPKVQVQSLTVHFIPDESVTNPIDFPVPNVINGANLLLGNQVSRNPDPAAGSNGQTNDYTVLVPSSVFSGIDLSQTPSHRSDKTQLWVSTVVMIKKDDGSNLYSGPTLGSGCHFVDENKNPAGIVFLDSSIQIMQLGQDTTANVPLNLAATPLSAFSAQQVRSHREAPGYLSFTIDPSYYYNPGVFLPDSAWPGMSVDSFIWGDSGFLAAYTFAHNPDHIPGPGQNSFPTYAQMLPLGGDFGGYGHPQTPTGLAADYQWALITCPADVGVSTFPIDITKPANAVPFVTASCNPNGNNYINGYTLSAEVNTSTNPVALPGTCDEVQVPNREEGVLVVSYYGKKTVTDLSNTVWQNDGRANTGGVVNVCWVSQNVDAHLFQNSSGDLEIYSEDAAATTVAALNALAAASCVANQVCAILAVLPGAQVEWACGSALFGTTSGLTAWYISGIDPNASDKWSNARAEYWAGLTITDSFGNPGAAPTIISPVSSGTKIQGFGAPVNTLTLMSMAAKHAGTNTTLKPDGDVHIQTTAAALQTWKLFTSGSATTYAAKGYYKNYLAHSYVIVTQNQEQDTLSSPLKNA